MSIIKNKYRRRSREWNLAITKGSERPRSQLSHPKVPTKQSRNDKKGLSSRDHCASHPISMACIYECVCRAFLFSRGQALGYKWRSTIWSMEMCWQEGVDPRKRVSLPTCVSFQTERERDLDKIRSYVQLALFDCFSNICISFPKQYLEVTRKVN